MPSKLLKLILPLAFMKFSVDEPDGGGAAPAVPATTAKPETFTREYVAELRHENASYRTKATEEAKKATDAETRALQIATDSEAKILASTNTANERIIRAELKAEALKAGMVDLDGLKLADLSTVKLNEAGEVVGAEDLMKSLKEAKPYLFGTTITTSSTATIPKPQDGKIKLATEMTIDEYQKSRNDIRRGILPKAA